MTFTQILAEENTSDETKLTEVVSLVKEIRKTYGNSDVVLEAPEVNTADGLKPITFLTAKDKLALAERVIKAITTDAYEDVQQAEGVSFDRRVEEMVSINPILSNLQTSNGSKYL